jgi:hypothetical protein
MKPDTADHEPLFNIIIIAAEEVYKFCTAQIPKATVAISPPKEKRRIGASPPSKVVPTRSPTFLAYLLLGPEHWGHLNPGPCSSKYIPAHSARL